MASNKDALQLNSSVLKELANRSSILVFVEVTPMVILMITSFMGNLLVCLVIIKFARLRTIPSLFVFNLAISDIAMALFCMPVAAVTIAKGQWIGNVQFCKANGFLMFSFGNLSLMTLALIAINRYAKVVRPNLYQRLFSKKNSLLMVCAAWLLPPFSTFPPLLGWGSYKFFPEKGFCLFPFHESISFTIFVELVFIGTPLIAIHICYYKIFKAIKKHRQMIEDAESSSDTISNAELSITKTLATVVIAFVACWTPVSIMDFYDMATGSMHLPRQLYLLNTYLIFTSSTINPIIYGLGNSEFRQAYKEFVLLRSSSNRNENNLS